MYLDGVPMLSNKIQLENNQTLAFSSQGRACAKQWLNLNYLMKNLGWILIMLKVNSAKTSYQFSYSVLFYGWELPSYFPVEL